MTIAGAPEDLFAGESARLLGLAYRILGSLVEAEDVVQEAWLRWSATDQGSIERPPAWLTTVTTRLALDRLKTAHRRREAYVGPWLPEPILTSPGPEEAVEAAETLTLGFLAMLEQLDPTARVVFLLTDVFGYGSDEVAAAVSKSPAACRQIASRARRRLRGAKPSRPSATDRIIADRLLAAVGSGDTAAGFRLTDSAREQDAAIVIDTTDGTVTAIWVVTNPDKLTRMESPAAIN